MWTIVKKEFRGLLYSPKYLLVFSVSAVLILLSLYNGYADYIAESRSARLGDQVALQDARGLGGYGEIEDQGLRISRHPTKMSIFSQGISGVVGQRGLIRAVERPRARDSRFSLAPILAVFGQLDLTFTVGIILSLFALLFSYNALCGERESGTLRLIMSNSVGRTSVVLGKLVGGYMPLALLFMLPFLAGLAAIQLLGDVNFTAFEWIMIAGLALAALLYLLVFYCLGLAISAATHNSFLSFLLCQFIWVLSVAIVPKVAVQAAAQVHPTFSIDEVESRLLNYKNSRTHEWFDRMNEYFAERSYDSPEALMSAQEVKGQEIRDQIRREDQQFQDGLFHELELRRRQMMDFATAYSRASPTSCFSFISHALSGTGAQMLDEFERGMLAYRQVLVEFLRTQMERIDESPEDVLSLNLSVSSSGGYTMTFSPEAKQYDVDLSALPRFATLAGGRPAAAGDCLLDYALLAFYAVLLFALAFVAFLRYDVR